MAAEHEQPTLIDYLPVIAAFPPRAIQAADQLDEAVLVMNHLLEKNHLSAAEREYLNTLSTLVEAYEREHIPLRCLAWTCCAT